MKKKTKRIGLCGDSKPSFDLVPNDLRQASAGAGAAIDPSGLPHALTPSDPGSSS
ncbi:MAG TPA: hypothetical protein VKM72_16110 [Thermoanaerobaculia bacterium]|nr:hypothetical protein [Thermoanaerobaculia bacterium]